MMHVYSLHTYSKIRSHVCFISTQKTRSKSSPIWRAIWAHGLRTWEEVDPHPLELGTDRNPKWLWLLERLDQGVLPKVGKQVSLVNYGVCMDT